MFKKSHRVPAHVSLSSDKITPRSGKLVDSVAPPPSAYDSRHTASELLRAVTLAALVSRVRNQGELALVSLPRSPIDPNSTDVSAHDSESTQKLKEVLSKKFRQ